MTTPATDPAIPARQHDDLRDCFAILARGLKRVAIYRHDVARHADYLAPAHAALTATIERHGGIEVTLTPVSFTLADEAVYTEPASDSGMCFRLHRDGVRTLSFRKGIPLVELAQFVAIAMPDPSSSGREDAVTELWKADLGWIGFKSDRGWSDPPGELEGPVANAYTSALAATAHVGAPAVETDELTQASADALDRLLAPEPWDVLAGRTVRLIVGVATAGYAGRDLEALVDVTLMLVEEALRRGDAGALSAIVEPVTAGLQAPAPAPEVKVIGERVGDHVAHQEQLELLLGLMLSAPTHAPVLLTLVDLLPASAGARLVTLVPDRGDRTVRQRIALAAAARAAGAEAAWGTQLTTAPSPVARELLEALPSTPFQDVVAIAQLALAHRAPDVREAAVRAIGADPVRALATLAPLLNHPDPGVRSAAARGLVDAEPEAATRQLLKEIGSAGFNDRTRSEREAFVQSLGLLETDAAFATLTGWLTAPRPRLLNRDRDEEVRLLAVVGLGAMRSDRAAAFLEGEAEPGRQQPATVVAASRAAARSIREALRRRGDA